MNKEPETVKHVLIYCNRYNNERRQLVSVLENGQNTTLVNPLRSSLAKVFSLLIHLLNVIIKQ